MGLTLGVVVPTLNGEGRIQRLIEALREQDRPVDEIVVVDDGSTDRTATLLEELGLTPIRHDRNRGAAAARNSGIDACRSSIVAFLDDDCAPHRQWSTELLAAYAPYVVGVGGRVIPDAENPYVRAYLRRHNPLRALEADLSTSSSPWFRLWLYVKRQFLDDDADYVRPVYAFAGANMSFRRDDLVRVGGLDPALFFGGEDTELSRRILDKTPGGRLMYSPKAVVDHHFDSRLNAVLKRSWVYGRASAWLYLRNPRGAPTVFPGPILFALIGLALGRRRKILPLILVPYLLYPAGLHGAVVRGQPDALVDPLMKILYEGAGNVGFLAGVVGEGRRRLRR